MNYDLSQFSVISVKRNENKENSEETCKKCNKQKHLFVLLEDCGHVFCSDCVDEMYDMYTTYDNTISTNNESSLYELFTCTECNLRIYNISYK